MTNALFYTFSTIAQTLAGAIALLGAFLLYRLQTLNSEVDSHSMTLRDTCKEQGSPHAGQAYLLHHEGKHRELIDLVKKLALPAEINPAFPLEHLSAALTLRESLFRRFYWALWLTAGLIVASVIVLAVATVIAPDAEKCNAGTVVVLAVGILWLAACIMS